MKTARDCSRWRETIRAQASEGVTGDQFAQLESHLAACSECRRYAEELRAAAAGLRWLADRPVEPSPRFRARWTRAVEAAAQPASLGETAAALGARWREWLLRNLRPALGVGSIWILALLFRLSAPGVSPAAQTTVARSPVEVARVLGADQPLLVRHLWRLDPLSIVPRRAQPPRPRSEAPPAQPAAQSDYGSDLPTVLAAVHLDATAREDSSGSLPV